MIIKKTFTSMAACSLILLAVGPIDAYSEGNTEAKDTKGNLMASYDEGVAGMTIVNSVEVSAKVLAINTVDRKLRLLREDGKEITISIGKEAVNFDQIKVNDKLNVTVVKELIVAVNKVGITTDESTTGMIVTAPKGDKPAALAAESTVVTAKVVKIDQEKHTATIEFKDGHTKTFSVREDVDLSKHEVGEEVVFQISEMIGIKVEKQ